MGVETETNHSHSVDCNVDERLAQGAKDQWACIEALERRHKGKPVRGTMSKFEDVDWRDGEGRSDDGRIIWSTLDDDDRPAANLFIRLVTCDILTTRRMRLASTISLHWAYKCIVKPIIIARNLLKGRPGDYLLCLSEIQDADLALAIDSLFATTLSKKTLLHRIQGLEHIVNCSRHLAEALPQFEIRAELPWRKAGMKRLAWIERHAIDLGILLGDEGHYAPFPPETAMPLIEHSLALTDANQHQHWADIASLLRSNSNPRRHIGRYSSPPWEELVVRYEPVIAAIEPAPIPKPRTGRLEKTSQIFTWLRHTIYLVRGACVNIILLTTGLRNTDIRRLTVGCCTPSNRVDMLYYLRANIKKTNNFIIIPVPKQTFLATHLLEQIKQTDSPFLLDARVFSSKGSDFAEAAIDDPAKEEEDDTGSNIRLSDRDALNRMMRDFAAHFNIPFIDPHTGQPLSAHCGRTTVAGWIGSSSNLAVLLLRRLFGHSNELMPSQYIYNNPLMIEERQRQRVATAQKTSQQLASAAAQGRLAGNKGSQMLKGFEQYKTRMEAEPNKSHSLTEPQIITSFQELIAARILDDSMCGFLTPFSVVCGRNPSDSRQPPCAKQAHHNLTEKIDKMVLDHLNAVAPEHCIGGACHEAIIGPWSESIRDSVLWNAALLRHQAGAEFDEEYLFQAAREFIKQYADPVHKVFKIHVLPDGTVKQKGGTHD